MITILQVLLFGCSIGVGYVLARLVIGYKRCNPYHVLQDFVTACAENDDETVDFILNNNKAIDFEPEKYSGVTRYYQRRLGYILSLSEFREMINILFDPNSLTCQNMTYLTANGLIAACMKGDIKTIEQFHQFKYLSRMITNRHDKPQIDVWLNICLHVSGMACVEHNNELINYLIDNYDLTGHLSKILLRIVLTYISRKERFLYTGNTLKAFEYILSIDDPKLYIMADLTQPKGKIQKTYLEMLDDMICAGLSSKFLRTETKAERFPIFAIRNKVNLQIQLHSTRCKMRKVCIELECLPGSIAYQQAKSRFELSV